MNPTEKKMNKKPTTIDQYLAQVPAEKSAVLEKLRAVVQNTVPEAIECISYGLPAFRLKGKVLVAFGAAQNHCAFYPMSPAVIETYQAELSNFSISKGTIRFTAEKPLSEELVQLLLKKRMAEIIKKQDNANASK